MSERDRPDHDDRARFESIYRATRIPVLGYLARRTGSPEDAAELLAEVYLVAWRRIADVPTGDEARLWLFGVARRVLANHYRRSSVETRLAGALQAGLRLLEQAEDDNSTTDPRQEIVLDALSDLSVSDRELLALSLWEDLTPAQIAAVINRPTGVVRVRLHRARKRLREAIEDRLTRAEPAQRRTSLGPAASDGSIA